MEAVGDSMDFNNGKDLLLQRDWVKSMALMFVGEGGNIKDQYANPLYADLKGLPPIYIHVGGDEVLLDDSRRFAEKAMQANVAIKVDIFPGMQHTFQMAAGRAPESNDSINRLAEWVKPKLGLL